MGTSVVHKIFSITRIKAIITPNILLGDLGKQCEQNAASDQGLHYLLTECSIVLLEFE